MRMVEVDSKRKEAKKGIVETQINGKKESK